MKMSKCVQKRKSQYTLHYLYGTVALMVLGLLSDICGLIHSPQISENWPRTITATVPQLRSDMLLISQQ